MSKITLRLVEKTDTRAEEGVDPSIAKLTGPTLSTLQQCLVSADESLLLLSH